LSLAFRTLTLGQELVGPFGCAGTVVVLHGRAQVFHDTVEIDKVVAGGVYQLFVDAYALQRAIENLVKRLLGNIVHLGLQVAVVFMQNGVNLPENHLVLVFA